jgi:uncharacterized membrane protein
MSIHVPNRVEKSTFSHTVIQTTHSAAMATAAGTQKIPVTMLSGFLGSGVSKLSSVNDAFTH